MIRYVVGFYFDETLTEVVLIKKIAKPGLEHFAGKLNGVGGKIEIGEQPYEAMIREFEEETSKEVYEWHCYGLDSKEGEYENYFFCSRGDLYGLRTTTMEEVDAYRVSCLYNYNLVDHVYDSVKRALEFLKGMNN